MRQPLKHPDELGLPDRRNAHYRVTLDDGAFRPFEARDLYKAALRLTLNHSVPEDIWDRFETVRNLFVYSWYVYDFTTPALLYAQTIVESALREKCKRAGIESPKYPSLRSWLSIAIEQRWLTNAAFPRTLEMYVEAFDAERGFVQTLRYEPGEQDYCRIIAETMPGIRNELAHGSSALMPQGMVFGSLELCADVINALFPDEEADELFRGPKSPDSSIRDGT